MSIWNKKAKKENIEKRDSTMNVALSQQVRREVTTPSFIQSGNKEWIPFKDFSKSKLDYPEFLKTLRSNNAWHNSILEFKEQQIGGKGLLSKDEATLSFLDSIDSDGDDINEMITFLAHDLAQYGGYCFLVDFSKDYSKVLNFRWLPFDKIRSGVAEDGLVKTYFFSFDWSKQRLTPTVLKAYIPKEIHSSKTAFKDAVEQNNIEELNKITDISTSRLYYYKPKTSPNFYYPLPSYIGAIDSIQTDIESQAFSKNVLKNGMAGCKHINIPGVKDAKERKREASNILKNHIGAINAGTPLITFSDTAETAVKVNDVSESNNGTTYKLVSDDMRQKILSGHRVSSPLLMGIALSGSLGNRQEMEDAYELFYATVIKPEQFKITKGINKFLKINGLKTVSIDKLGIYNEDLTEEQKNNEIDE